MRHRALLIVLAAVLVLFATPIAALGASTATVHGTVTGTDGPVAGATVTIDLLGRGGLPKRTAVQTTAVDGTWSYTGKASDHRFTFTADGYEPQVVTRGLVSGTTVELPVTLQRTAPPTGTITGRITGATGSGLFGYVYFYKQNADGTWPTAYLYQVATAPDGTYSSGPLALGSYKVRLFTVHTGVQWYRYAATMDAATPVVLGTAGQVVTGIDAQYPAPAP